MNESVVHQVLSESWVGIMSKIFRTDVHCKKLRNVDFESSAVRPPLEDALEITAALRLIEKAKRFSQGETRITRGISTIFNAYEDVVQLFGKVHASYIRRGLPVGRRQFFRVVYIRLLGFLCREDGIF